ncbi:MAG: TIGR02300 family protein [Hyphomicrobium sp.]|uniref:TIGR02300 family protein n=1 Tax=Hyphomicrobium sp. TaxID=82 RepID=UPI001328B310|nr:TIGR02300 family protein [Hyphomicrobium sp.]KAB2939778.1 MAG: TIGR02300 family protein [Hyphomicrobium sp.]MBZ0208177.1 TIGR02300 family protein [Hyphomicrobium sp.]MCZ7594585.1 TIGR02300 family protein [Hyphomicrobium sp.]
MATNKDRGTKRTCQNSECGARFYDLNRSPIVCPICGAKYAIAHSPTTAAVVAQEEKAQRKVKKPEFEPVAGDAEAEDALVDVEADEAEDAAGEEADETFLEEEEEDGGDVSNIIGGPVEGEDER